MKDKPLQTLCPHCKSKSSLQHSELKRGPACSQCNRPMMPAQLIKLTDDDFPALLKGEQVPWVIDFWAPWCGPCKRMGPIFEQLAKSALWPARFAKINIDHYPSVARRQNVQSIPALVVYVGSKEIARLTGVQPKQKIQQWLDQAIRG